MWAIWMICLVLMVGPLALLASHFSDWLRP